ncbi:MAG TPA: methyltransferase domain-containing protein [Kiritimatiellia bacterium]|nr:methyltransferase domain-containing protein [Kiritimatiellia bacterium]
MEKTPSSPPLTDYLSRTADYLAAITRLFGDYKRRTFSALQIQPGQRMLDAGCGTGDDLIALARHLGPAAELHGIDVSPELIERARARAEAEKLPLHFEVMDLLTPRFPPASFHRIRCDRVFQHLPEPAAALRTLVALTCPGGLILVADVDWTSLRVEHPDPATTALILDAQRKVVPSPDSGRKLHTLFHHAGLADIETHAETICITDPGVALFVTGLGTILDHLRQTGALPSEAADAWLRDAGQPGFFCSLTGYMTHGRVP